jgi:putative flippase GtrA
VRSNSLPIGEIIKFTIVGGVSTSFHYLVLLFAVEILGLSPVTGTMIGYCAGAVVSYFLSLRYTFRSTARHRIAIPKFIIMVGCGFIINVTCMYLFETILSITYMVSQVFATACVFVWNFIVSKLWAFANPINASSITGENK